MNDHFVQRRDEQGALVKQAPDSNSRTSAIDAGALSGSVFSTRHTEPPQVRMGQAGMHGAADLLQCGKQINLLPHRFSADAGQCDGDGPDAANADAGRALAASDALGSSPRPDSVFSTSALTGTQRRILIVDDNVDAAESLGELLKACGHDIHIAHDGASAIAEASRLRPEAVILDIGLPAMNGYEVAQRLRLDVGLNASLLVALTGYAEESDRISAQKAGFDHYFAKPLDIGKLVTVINNMK